MPEGSIRRPLEAGSAAPVIAGEVARASTTVAAPIRVLHVEDNLLDAELVSAMLQAEGVSCSVQVVDTEAAFRTAIALADIDLVICDYSIPSFSGLAALAITRSTRPDLPFIFVSGTMGEERAIDALKEGATDYVLKQRLGRLGSAVRRALAEKAAHQARVKAEREQREAQEGLRRSEAQFSAVAETIPCALFIYQGNRRVYVNRWAEQLTGYTREELLGGDFWDIVHPDQQEEVRQRGLARQRGEHVASVYELRLRTKGGEDRWALVSTCALEFEGRPAALGTAVDITDRKRAEEALRRQAATLAHTEKLAAMGCLLAGVAHELNNPLAVVVGHTHLLRRGLEGAQAERASKISSAAERCARIVKNFLAVARQRPPERQWVQLNKLVEEVLELVSYSLNASGIEVVLDLPAGLPALWADPHQLHQVLVNLITNAQHALRQRPPGQRRLLVGVGMHDERTACVEVVDTGPGIPAEIASRIFEPFFTTKPAGEGTGLGLSLCRGIVESHGGTMWLHTDVGRGTLFRIELPITRGPVETPAVTEAPTRPGVGARLLVVDDEAALGAMIAELLTTQGHQVDVVTDGQHALERLAASRYDVILSDLRMPGMDGPGLYAEVQKRYPGQERCFVFLTGDTFTGGTAEFLERSGVPSLAKPFTLDEMERAVLLIRSRVAR
jgi:PAS domain S-box-containing protein